jgi:hypothetical protein
MPKQPFAQKLGHIPLFLGDHIQKWETGETDNNSCAFEDPGIYIYNDIDYIYMYVCIVAEISFSRVHMGKSSW